MRMSFQKLALYGAVALACLAQSRKIVNSESDLPRFTYPVTGNIADLLRPDSPAFKGFAAKVEADLQSVLANYQIEDKATRRELLAALLSFEELNGKNNQGLRTIETIRGLEDKPDARLAVDLIDEAMLRARLDAKSDSGTAYNAACTRRFSEAVNALPWNVAQDRIKSLKGSNQIMTSGLIAGMIASDLQPMVDKSGTVDNQTAWRIIGLRASRLCHSAGGELEQIQFLLGHVSIQTTERYFGCKQRIRSAMNDRLGIEPRTESA